MSGNLFILGAGASCDAGAPLMSNFIDKAEDLFFKGCPEDKKEDFRNVFELIANLNTVFAKSFIDITNIEALFGAIEMGLIINKLGGITQKEDIQKIKDSLINLIVTTLEYNIKFPVRDGVSATESYGTLAKMLDGNEISTSIITFNYDIALDTALNLKGVGYSYGLPNDHTDGINLLKLHGSTNWGICPECQQIYSASLSNYFTKRVSDYKIRKRNEIILNISKDILEMRCTNCHSGLNESPVIVPPTWNKNEYHGGLTKVWQQAAKELSEARNIFVIGYSLPESDSFFRYLFSLGTDSHTRLRRFWVFDPDPTNSVNERFERLLGQGVRHRYRYFKQTFREALNTISDEEELNLNRNKGIY